MVNKEVVAAKEKKVDKVVKDFEDAVSAIIVDYRGLTVAEVTDLRQQLRDSGIKFNVIKNKILERAADKAGVEELKDTFVGPTAVAFSEEDSIAPTKILKKFSDNVDSLEIKGGIIDGKIVSIDDINTYASLPGREELLATLANILQAPVRNVAYAVKAVVDKKGEEEEEKPKEKSTEDKSEKESTDKASEAKVDEKTTSPSDKQEDPNENKSSADKKSAGDGENKS